MEAKKLSKDRMKKYMARRKWQVIKRARKWARCPNRSLPFLASVILRCIITEASAANENSVAASAQLQ